MPQHLERRILSVEVDRAVYGEVGHVKENGVPFTLNKTQAIRCSDVVYTANRPRGRQRSCLNIKLKDLTPVCITTISRGDYMHT